MILCSNSRPICLTFSLASHDSKFSSFRRTNTSRWSPAIACATLLSGSEFPGLLLAGSEGNRAYGQIGVGSTISTSRCDFSAIDVLTMSWSETRGLFRSSAVRIGGVEFIDPKAESLRSTDNGGGATASCCVSVAVTVSGILVLPCHAEFELRSSSNRHSATILAVSD